MGYIDVDTGLMYCGDDEDIYSDVLNLYIQLINESKQVLTETLEAGDIPAYTVRVHAVKSNSRNVGAAGIGDMAEKLEMAGKENNVDFIKENTPALLKVLDEAEAEAKQLLDEGF